MGGICSPRASVRAEMTLPSALRLWLIFLLSSRRRPVAPVSLTRSLPARSTCAKSDPIRSDPIRCGQARPGSDQMRWDSDQVSEAAKAGARRPGAFHEDPR